MNRIRLTTADAANRRAFTLVELLVAAMLTLMLTALIVQMFAFVSDGVFNSRANIEMGDSLRNARERLIRDLRGTTAPTTPPLDPTAEQGYFEYFEGPQVANRPGHDSGDPSVSPTSVNGRWTIYGDKDDILMFTSADYEEPFVGKWGSTAHRSPVAEVAWFARGNRLHRRVFMVNLTDSIGSAASYANYDLSMRELMGAHERSTVPPIPPASGGGSVSSNMTHRGITIPNGLGDLTMRERRSLHQPYIWPYEMRLLGTTAVNGFANTPWAAFRPPMGPHSTGTHWLYNLPSGFNPAAAPFLSLPTVSHTGPLIDSVANSSPGNVTLTINQRNNTRTDHPVREPFTAFNDQTDGTSREFDDIMLTGLVSFDIKAWDPGAPIFRATSAAGGSVGLLMPGDPGYGYGVNFAKPTGALEKFINGEGTHDPQSQPVGFGAYADLNYMWIPGLTTTANELRQYNYLKQLADARNVGPAPGRSPAVMPLPSFGFATRGRPLSGFPLGGNTTNVLPAVYDTWSRHYEYDGIDNDGDGQVDEGTNGVDDNGNGFIDEAPGQFDVGSFDSLTDPHERWLAEINAERDAPPPYDAPLRGVKITIRVMEEDSRQVREVSVVHEFLPY